MFGNSLNHAVQASRGIAGPPGVVLNEIQTLYRVTLFMLNEINNNNVKIQIVDDRVNGTIKNIY